MIHPATIADAIADFLEGASPGEVLSLARAVNQIRGTMPRCDLTDVELAEVVAIRAMEMGFVSVMFDLCRTQPSTKEPGSSKRRRSDQEEPGTKKIIAAMPELRRTARKMADDPEHADQMLERALLVAIATVHSRPSDQPFEEWLCDVLGRVASASRRSH